MIEIAGVLPPLEIIGDVPVTEVTVPVVGVVQILAPPPAEVNTCPDVPALVPIRKAPVRLMSPTISNLYAGVIVKIPTLPDGDIRIHSVSVVLNINGCASIVPRKFELVVPELPNIHHEGLEALHD